MTGFWRCPSRTRRHQVSGACNGHTSDPHDFRRTFRSICEMAGVSHSIGALLNHNQSKSITSRWVRRGEMLLAALHLFNDKLDELIKGEPFDDDPSHCGTDIIRQALGASDNP